MTVSQPPPQAHEHSSSLYGGGEHGGVQQLSVRTDSITLNTGALAEHLGAMSRTNASMPFNSQRASGGSSHQKMPSAGSLSSISSAGSKTAAFFNTPTADLAVRPTASTSSTSLGSASRQVSSPPQRVNSLSRDPTRESNIAEEGTSFMSNCSSARSSFAALKSPSDTYSTDGLARMDTTLSPSNSLRDLSGRRSWVDFDGKPIVALPSPGIMDDESLNPMDDPQTVQMRLHTGFGKTQDQETNTFTRQEPSPITSSRIGLSGTSDESSKASKTRNFFGTTWTSGKLLSAKGDRSVSQGAIPSTPSSNASSSRTVSAQSIRQPALTSQLATQTSQNTSATGADDTSAPQLPSLSVQGTQPLVPSAFISPPSPDPMKEDTSQCIPQPTDSPPFTRNGPSRHTHGPSENATSSSILPQAELVQIASKAAESYNAGIKSSSGHGSNGYLANPLGPTTTANSSAQVEEQEDETESRVGAYSVDRVLGVGAFSRVVLAKRIQGRPTTAEARVQRTSNGLVALKMLEKEPCRQNERMRVSWVREVEVLKHVVHPNIVRFLTSFSTNKHHVLVLESVEGGELFEYLAQEQREIASREWLLRRLFGELANAVGWMHQINLVHRDIKLENILLTQHFRRHGPLTPSSLPHEPLIKLSDFGLSRFIDPKSPLLETRCGSEEYAAPELIIGRRYDGRQTDVWAMGVVLYALLSGSLPFLSDLYDSTANASGTTSSGQGSVANARENSHHQGQVDARARKAQLLRIAKGDLRWPMQTNEASLDVPDASVCPSQHRLITPTARLLVARILRRDAAKRCQAWDVWDEVWMTQGSFGNQEASMLGQPFAPPLDPRCQAGQAWLNAHAHVRAGAPDVVTHDD